jgi:hypothetical protein
VNALTTEMNLTLPGSWFTATATGADLISTEANGDQHWRLKYPTGGAAQRFLRLNIVP